jgi:NADPH:quinone reductase-like Zn-dependent oxidoreductase
MARKVVYERSGDPAQVVRIVEGDGPQAPQRGQVLVRVTAFSVHPGDLAHLQARGIAYGDRPRRQARRDRMVIVATS